MPAQPVLGVAPNQSKVMRLPRSLSCRETWGFGLMTILVWLVAVSPMNAALEPQAILVLLPATLVGILENLQVKRLGEQCLATYNYFISNLFFPIVQL